MTMAEGVYEKFQGVGGLSSRWLKFLSRKYCTSWPVLSGRQPNLLVRDTPLKAIWT